MKLPSLEGRRTTCVSQGPSDLKAWGSVGIKGVLTTPTVVFTDTKFYRIKSPRSMARTRLFTLLLAASAWLVGFLSAHAVDTVAINVTNVLNDTSRRQFGLNTEYWWDNQANRAPGARPLDAALRDIGAKFLRYPGGEKSDGYLWSLPPFTNSYPMLARIGPDDWPSNDPLYFTNGNWSHPIYDFDEFMADCRAAAAEPNLVVAYDGIFKAATHGGTSLTRTQALETAVAWVRYANLTKGYNVRYWEIGNESWLSGYMGTSPGSAQYAADLVTFSRAMKAVDPTIKIGANANDSAWLRDILQTAAADIDFLIVHAYPCYGWKKYSTYRSGNPDLGIVTTAATALTNYAPTHVNRIKIAMTETASATWSSWTANDLGHALPTFDIFGQLLADRRVDFAEFWNTRWINNTVTPHEVWDALGPQNELLPAGRALAIWGQFLQDHMVSASSSSALVRSWASHSSATRKLNVFLINKDTAARAVTVTLQNYAAPINANRWVFSGNGDADLNPVWAPSNAVPVSSNQLSLTLGAVSITVLELAPSNPPPVLNVAIASPGQVALTWSGVGGLAYAVQTSTNLTSWLDVGVGTEVSAGSFQFLDAIGTNSPAVFYRVRTP